MGFYALFELIEGLFDRLERKKLFFGLGLFFFIFVVFAMLGETFGSK